MLFIRLVLFAGLVALLFRPVAAEDVLFIGNSFTFGASAPVVRANGGVPKLVEEIAQAKGKKLATSS